MNVTFGIMDPLKKRIRNKRERYALLAEQALEIVKNLSQSWKICTPLKIVKELKTNCAARADAPVLC